jgi:AraC-like DNA-binding protein
MNHRNADMTPAGSTTAPLTRAIERHARKAGDHVTAVSALSFHRRNAPTEPLACIYSLSLCVTTQGEKQIMLGGRILNIVPGRSFVTTLDLPVVSHIRRATARNPYLALLLKLDPRTIALAASELPPPPSERHRVHEPISVERIDGPLHDALLRLISLLDEHALLSSLAPLIEQEIILRLLAGRHGTHLRQLVNEESPGPHIARVVAWIKQNFTRAVRIDELAANANMSPSAFRQHFRRFTGMSPLQYLKQLRLQEARELMLHQHADASQAASLVGYHSPSQFSREYRRFFGAPPQLDILRVRSR